MSAGIVDVLHTETMSPVDAHLPSFYMSSCPSDLLHDPGKPERAMKMEPTGRIAQKQCDTGDTVSSRFMRERRGNGTREAKNEINKRQ